MITASPALHKLVAFGGMKALKATTKSEAGKAIYAWLIANNTTLSELNDEVSEVLSFIHSKFSLLAKAGGKNDLHGIRYFSSGKTMISVSNELGLALASLQAGYIDQCVSISREKGDGWEDELESRLSAPAYQDGTTRFKLCFGVARKVLKQLNRSGMADSESVQAAFDQLVSGLEPVQDSESEEQAVA
jgi:hypothetical protein